MPGLANFLETRIVSFVSSTLRGPVVVHHFGEHVCGLVLKASPFGGNTFRHEMFVNYIASMNTNCLELDVCIPFLV